MAEQGANPIRPVETAQRDQMSDHEALMWQIEKDPWLNPNGASLILLDRPIDFEGFRRNVRFGVAQMPRLYQRVVPGFAGLSTPTWEPDADFNFDHHVREIVLPAPGTQRQLFDLVTALYEEPLDRTRPLWRFVAISGLEGDRGAVYALVHHVISDGIGQLRMAEMYQQFTRDEAPRPEVDLEGIVADAADRHHHNGPGGILSATLASSASKAVIDITGRQLRRARRKLGSAMMVPADPGSVARSTQRTVASATSIARQLRGTANEIPGGSELWRTRSRHRRLEYVSVPMAGLRTAAHTFGGSVNDAFLAGIVEGSVRYHKKRGEDVEAFNTSFVVSTRSDNVMGGNAFTPVPVQLPGGDSPVAERVMMMKERLDVAKNSLSTSVNVASLAGVVNLLPTSAITRTARAQAGRIDFATSNLRGAPREVYCSGALVEAVICMGPVAGTAANFTAMSYDDQFDIGIHVDPVAIDDPEDFQRCIQEAFEDLLAASG